MRLGFILDTSKSASGYRVEFPMNALVEREDTRSSDLMTHMRTHR